MANRTPRIPDPTRTPQARRATLDRRAQRNFKRAVQGRTNASR